MKTFNITLKTRVQALNMQHAELVAQELSIVQGEDAQLLDIHERRVLEVQ